MKKKIPFLIITSFTCLSLALTSPALARNAKCLIKSSGMKTFQGTCLFQSDSDGSFALSRSGKRRFLKNVDIVSISVMSRGKADVRGLTKQGINSRWGFAKRSRRDRACWIGADFKICAW